MTERARHGRRRPAAAARAALPARPHPRPRAAARARPRPRSGRARRRAAGSPPAWRRAGLRVHRALTAADYYRQGIGAVRALRPALLHCNDWNTMWIGVAAKLGRGTHVVYDSHELWADRNGRPELRPWLLAAEALFVRAADEVVTDEPRLRRRAGAALPHPAPDARPQPPRPAARPTAARPVGPPTLVYVGGLLRGRGLEQAIEALALVPELRIALIGPVAEPYRAELLSGRRALRRRRPRRAPRPRAA